MTRILFFVSLLAAAWVGWRIYKLGRKRRANEIPRAKRAATPRVTTLEKDPVTGVYRPMDQKD